MAPIVNLTRSARLVAIALAAAATTARAQEAEPDTAAASPDTAGAVPDTVTTPGDTAAADTIPRAFRPGLSFPERPGDRAETSASEIRTWERSDLLDTSALTLADFLQDQAAGVHVLRAGYFFGEHHLMDGLAGPAGVRVLVDGIEVLPLAGGQPDLSRISLVAVDRIRLERRAGETLLRIELNEHPGGEAYSRINAGTGQPAADLVRGVFTNGAGRSVTVTGAVDHLNVDAGEGEGRRLDAFASGSWMPFGPGFGVRVRWKNESVERTRGGTTEEFTRRDLGLRMRANVAEGVQFEAWGASARRDPQSPFLPTPPAEEPPPGEEPVPGEEPEPPALSADQLGARLTVRTGGARLEGRYARIDAEGMPEGRGGLEGGVRLGPLVADASYGWSSWDGFSTSVVSGGLALRPEGFPASVRVDGATGSRAVALPGRAVADSALYDFDAIGAGADLELGPYRIGGSVRRRTQERHPSFGGSFDRLLPPGPEVEATFLTGRFAGPIVPFGFLRDRLEVDGFWRSASFADESSLPYYVPRELGRGEVFVHDRFFEDNLEVRLALRAERRGEMATARPGSDQPVLVEPRTVLGTDLLIRIDVFRIWWRVENLRSGEHRDFADLPYPTRRNVFGVRWEFFN